MTWKNEITLSQQGKGGLSIWVQSCSVQEGWLQHNIMATFICAVVFLCRFWWTWFNKSCSNFSVKGISKNPASRHLSYESDIGSLSMRLSTLFFQMHFRCSSVCLEIQYIKLYWERLQSPELIAVLSIPKASCEGKFITCLRWHLIRVCRGKLLSLFLFQQFISAFLANNGNLGGPLVLQWSKKSIWNYLTLNKSKPEGDFFLKMPICIWEGNNFCSPSLRKD